MKHTFERDNDGFTPHADHNVRGLVPDSPIQWCNVTPGATVLSTDKGSGRAHVRDDP